MRTYETKLSLVERAMWELLQKVDHNEIQIEENWVQEITPQAPVAYLNGIFKCQLDESEARERIAKAVANYKKLNLPFRFKISPSTKPSNIVDILKENNLEKKETLFGLFADPMVLEFPTNQQVQIKQLDLSTVEDWLIVQGSAWGVPSQGIEFLRTQTKKSLEDNTKNGLNFIAYYKNKPVGSAGMKFSQDYAYLMGAAVNPENRKMGIYRALMSHRLEIIKKSNLPAIIHCLEQTSAPICLKLGFEKICEIQSYEPKP